MKTATEYRPGRWALLDAGAVVGTTADPAEAAAWAARDQDLDAGPLFAAEVGPLVAMPAAAVTQDEARGLAMSRDMTPDEGLPAGPALVSPDELARTQDEGLRPWRAASDATRADHAGPAYLWLDGPNGADLQTWWASAVASWRRRSGRADGLPAETRARPDELQALRQVTPAAVRLVECQAVQRGTVWVGPVASEVTP